MAEPAIQRNLPRREDDRAWPAQGRWTYEDYRLLPDDGRRYEVIRGNLHVTPAPSVTHQRAVSRLFRHLDRFVADNQLGEVLMSPLDVLLPRGIGSPVQPDLVFFRRGTEPRPGALNFQGVPGLVVEVLSPGTRRFDTTTKLTAYGDAGVPEVWLADPEQQTLVVFGLAEDGRTLRELGRSSGDEPASSRVLPGFQLAAREVFRQPES